MGEFIGEDALELDSVELGEEPTSHDHAAMPRVASECDRVGRVLGDHEQAWPGQAGGRAESVDEIEQSSLSDRLGWAGAHQSEDPSRCRPPRPDAEVATTEQT